MITKGRSFTFMYETRNKNTGDLVADAPVTTPSTHTIKVFYKNGSTWTSATIVDGVSPSDTPSDITSRSVFIGSDTGMYLCQISSTYTNCDHIIVSITSSNSDVIVPLQQFYPVDMDAISNAVWGRQSGSDRTLTSDTLGNNGSISASVWTYGDSTIDPSNHTRTVHRKLTTNELADAKQTPDKLALDGDFNVTIDGEGLDIDLPDAEDIASQVWSYSGRSLDSLTVTTTINGSPTQRTLATTYDLGALQAHGDDTWGGTTINMENSGDPVAIDSNAIASAVLEGIPSAVWNMTVNGGTYNRMQRIADYVWGRDPYDEDRSLTTNVLDTLGYPTLALTTEVDTGTDFDPSTITFPDTNQIATAVWNYGKASGVANKNFRSLSNTAIVSSDGTTSKYIGTLSSSTNTIDAAVWASADKTLSSADIDDGTAIATTTDIPSIENLTDMLTKIFGVLCHWELSGDNIIVKNDNGDTILTIPTVKDKFGDIIQMDGTSEALL